MIIKKYKKLFLFILVLISIMENVCVIMARENLTSSVSDRNSRKEISVKNKRTEETRWYYRMNNGVREKRLWSITRGEWLTNWIPV